MKTETTTVEVNVDQTGWKFPATQAIRTADNGKKFYQIPVSYVLLEDADVSIPEDVATALRKAGVDDIIKEANAGFKLAQGDAVKAPFRVNRGSPEKRLAAAFKWLFAEASDRIAEFTALPPDKQPETLLGWYEDAGF